MFNENTGCKRIMKNRNGQTLVEWLVVIGIILIICVIPLNWIIKHIYGNKQIFDFNQNFKYAYVTEGTNTVKYSIKAWKDWKDSDAIQIITTDDRCIYTHLNQVILTDK